MIATNKTVFAQADIIANQTNQLETMKKEAVKIMTAYGKANADKETYRKGMIEYVHLYTKQMSEVERLKKENERLVNAVSKLFVRCEALEEKVEYYEGE